MHMARIAVALGFGVLAVLPSCASYNVVPKDLQAAVDDTVRFTQVHEAPDQYHGRTVLFGGEVLSAKRLKDGTTHRSAAAASRSISSADPRSDEIGRAVFGL
jgi:starvation-inducible outer membrane lipoprotein